MHYYFILQYRILNRRLTELGLHPILGYFLAVIVFVGLSIYLFYKTTYAGYLYTLIALSSISKWSDRERNDFLQATFPQAIFQQIRLLENGLLALPFVLYLLYEGEWILALLLVLGAFGLSWMRFADRLNFTFPTPFSRFPFEYTMGFRTSILFYLLAYFVGFKAVEVQNFNLGVGSQVFLFLLGMAHYSRPENEYFVWIYSSSAREFLFKKMATALLYYSMMSLPLLLGLSAYFFEKWLILLGFQCLGYFFLPLMILAKYSAFPGEISLPQAVLFALCLWFPPLLLVVVPLFYTRSIKRLNAILE